MKKNERIKLAKEIGRRIYETRECEETTLAVFGREVGVDSSTQWSYENGRTLPSPIYLNRLAKKYEVDLHWLITGEEQT